MLAVVHAVAQAVEVVKQACGVLVAERYHWIVVKAYAPAYAVVVRRQQALQELVVGSHPFHFHARVCCQVAGAVRVGHHHEVVTDYVVAMLIEDKAALAGRAQQVHAGVAQLGSVHRIKIVRINEIYRHGFCVLCVLHKVRQ